MIALYDNSGARLPIAYRGLTLNDPTETDPMNTTEVWAALVDAEHGALSESRPQRDGSEIYRPRKQRRLIRLTGAIKRSTMGALFDAAEELSAAFDPVNAYEADTSDYDKGFLALTFSRPTDDSANYPSGLKDLQYYARPLAIPVTQLTKNDGLAVRYEVLMECADPRAYAQNSSSANRNDAGTLNINNSLASYASWPTISIAIATASGVVDFELASDNWTKTIRLDLTGIAGTVTVDPELRTVKDDGVDAMGILSSPAEWWWIPPAETSVLTVANVSGNAFDGTTTVTWHKAFA